jgi:hypothetical protein
LLNNISDKYAIDKVNKENKEVLYSKKDSSTEQLHRNIYYIFDRIMQLIEAYYGEEWFSLHGSLLPTSNGHNSSLSRV